MEITENQLAEVLEQYRQDHPRTRRDDFFRVLNSILITVAILLITSGGIWMRNMESDRKEDLELINEKMDGLMIATLTNSAAITSHGETAQIHIDRITALEQGTALATMDRITKGEALDAINKMNNDMKKWVERYFQRK